MPLQGEGRVPHPKRRRQLTIECPGAGLQEEVRTPSGVHRICCFLTIRWPMEPPSRCGASLPW
jgi:hypothetical protein